jgi:hypothetical protein
MPNELKLRYHIYPEIAFVYKVPMDAFVYKVPMDAFAVEKSIRFHAQQFQANT